MSIFEKYIKMITLDINSIIEGLLFYMKGSPHGGGHIEIT